MALDQNPDPEEVARGEANADEMKDKLKAVGHAVGLIFGRDAPWVLAVVPGGGRGTLTIGNVDVPGQVRILKSVMHSFEADKSIELVKSAFSVEPSERRDADG